MNAYDQKMFMKREAIADKAIWTAKKRYMLNVYDNEVARYTEPKLKMMGRVSNQVPHKHVEIVLKKLST